MIIRSKATRTNFTIVPNEVFSVGLTAEAVGVLVFLIGKPEDWRVSAQSLAKHFGCGRDKMLRILQELVETGYAQQRRGGESAGFDWIIYDSPTVEKHDCRETRLSEISTTTKKRVSTKKKEEQRKEGSGENFALPQDVDPQIWQDFEDHRREIGKKLTDRARKLNAKILAGRPSVEQEHIVEATIRAGWTGLFPPKGKHTVGLKPVGRDGYVDFDDPRRKAGTVL